MDVLYLTSSDPAGSSCNEKEMAEEDEDVDSESFTQPSCPVYVGGYGACHRKIRSAMEAQQEGSPFLRPYWDRDVLEKNVFFVHPSIPACKLNYANIEGMCKYGYESMSSIEKTLDSYRL